MDPKLYEDLGNNYFRKRNTKQYFKLEETDLPGSFQVVRKLVPCDRPLPPPRRRMIEEDE